MTIASITAEIDAATTSAVSLVAEAADLVALEEVRREVLGKRSAVAKIKVSIKSLPAQDRPEAGRLLSLYNESIEEALTARQAQPRLDLDRVQWRLIAHLVAFALPTGHHSRRSNEPHGLLCDR